MTYNQLLGSIFLSLCFAGCAADASIPDSPEAPESAAPLAQYTYDTSDLALPLPTEVPSKRLGTASFDPSVIASSLLRTEERFNLTAQQGERARSESQSYTLEVNSVAGQLLILSKLRSGPAAQLQPVELTQQSLSRLTGWGLGSDELGAVLQRRTLRDDMNSGQATGPVLHRHKTFVLRALGGIPVQGHRAVLTYTPDGAFHRALIIWPPLATAGHALSSPLSIDEIKVRADSALRMEGIASGPVKLSWKYLPTVGSAGEATLRLVVAAHVRGRVQTTGLGEEAREIDVDVSAR